MSYGVDEVSGLANATINLKSFDKDDMAHYDDGKMVHVFEEKVLPV